MRLRNALLLFAAEAMTTSVFAYAPLKLPFPEIVVRPELIGESQSFADMKIWRDQRSGAVRLLNLSETLNQAFATDELTEAALYAVASRFIEEHLEIFARSGFAMSLVPEATLITKEDQSLSFDCYYQGLKIADGSVEFRFKGGRAVQVLNQCFLESLLTTTKTGQRPTAKSLRKKLRGLEVASRKVGTIWRVIEAPKSYEFQAVSLWEGRLNGEPVSVQALENTGEILQIQPKRHYANGKARGSVYGRTYFQSSPQSQPLGELGFRDGAATIYADRDGSFETTNGASVTGLVGKRARIVTKLGSTPARNATQTEGIWDLNFNVSTERDLAQVNAYFYLQKVVQYAKSYISSPWLERTLLANVNLNQTCNAYWDGSSVNFYVAGGRCGNTALISDVIFHEWGHGLDANTGGIQDSAYSEGFGDVVAMLMSGDSVMAPGFFSQTGGGIRNLAPDRVYPRDRGEAHSEGLIIAGAFWDLYEMLGKKYDLQKARDLTSKFAFRSIFTARRYTDVYQALLNLDRDGSAGESSPNFCEINRSFTLHGLAKKASNCS